MLIDAEHLSVTRMKQTNHHTACNNAFQEQVEQLSAVQGVMDSF
jgi:hypothetical protein